VVLVDGWETVHELYEELDHGRPLDMLLRLVRDGRSAGLSFAVTGGPGLLTGRLAAWSGRRVMLPMPDPNIHAAGLTARHPPAQARPGRGVVLPGGEQVQVAVLGCDHAGAAQNEVLNRLVETTAAGDDGGGPPPIRVEPLPSRVVMADIRADAKAVSPGCDWALLGAGGDDAGPVGVDIHRDGPWLLITGGPGSGRSTALLTAATWLLGEGRQIVIVAGPRSPVRALAGLPLVSVPGPDPDELRQVLGAGATATVVVDDAENLRATPTEQALLDAARTDDGQRLSFLVGCSLTEAVTGFRGLAAEARRGRTGLLLGALGPGDGEIFGLRLPRSAGGPTGRGLLVIRGTSAPVQVALPEIADGYR
jgi:S-DNA-T family DNA segregation ATPase FtsK/SpoIIIE